MNTLLNQALATIQLPTRQANRLKSEFARLYKNHQELSWKRANPTRVAKINARCRKDGRKG